MTVQSLEIEDSCMSKIFHCTYNIITFSELMEVLCGRANFQLYSYLADPHTGEITLDQTPPYVTV